MISIHKTAVIGSNVVIGNNVSIGISISSTKYPELLAQYTDNNDEE